MDKKTLDKVASILETAEEFYVPVKKLWKALREEGYDLPVYEEFVAQLRKDKRFELGKDFKKAKKDWDDEEMEKFGYYSGPRVKLTVRQITKEDMRRVVLKRSQEMIDNLVKAYQARPADLSTKDEDALIEVMRKAKSLRQQLDSVFKKKENKE